MTQKIPSIYVLILLFSVTSLFSQVKNEPQKANYVGKPTKVEVVPPISSRKDLPVFESKMEEMMDGRSSKYDIVAGKGSKGDDILSKTPHYLKNKVKGRTPSLVFETAASNSQPTDPAGAVGPNHYIAVTNTAFRIFDKSGNPLTGLLAPNPTIFPSGGCCDLTASYDNRANRWVVTFLGSGVQVAVSNGPDPVNDSWTVYTYNVVSDYQKLSIWSDGYYMTENTGSQNKVHVFERDAMLAGDPGAQIQSFTLPGMVTSGFHSPQALNITDNNFPAVGGATIVYMQDDSWNGVSQDHIKLWTVDVDWNNASNSTVSAATQIGIDAGTGTVSPFLTVFDGGSFSNLPQPDGGVLIDALQATIMNQAQFRKFPTYNSALFNFVVDTDGTNSKLAGVRWYELRQDGDNQPWSVHQEGTYVSPDGKHAWNASLAMDSEGNIGMGYTAMSGPTTSSTVRVGSYYTGRFSGDDLGVMTVTEEVIIAGDANIPGLRYGDYSKIDVDPVTDKQFWFVNEVMSNGRKNVAGVFQIASDKGNDVGVVSINSPITIGSFTNSETISVTLFNYGTNSASNFDVSYQIDGGTTITETYTGTLAANAYDTFTFNTTADLSSVATYFISTQTVLTSDEDPGNDFTVCHVTNIAAKDIGVVNITAPVSGDGLGNESITIEIQNFGGAAQSNFDVSYQINGGTPVVETVPGPINPQSIITHTFSITGNFSTIGEYTLSSTTLLTGDSAPENDPYTTTISHLSCLDETNSTTQPIGPVGGNAVTTSTIEITDNFIVDDVNVTINANHTWVGDLTVKLIAPEGTEVILANQVCGNCDDLIDTVFDDSASTEIASGTSPFTGSFKPTESLASLAGLASTGTWTLEITDVYPSADAGTLNSWSLQLCSNNSLSVDDLLVENDQFSIVYEDNDQFSINLSTSTITGKLNLNVINVLGQKLLWRTLENKSGNGYEYKLDMSYVSAGVYFIKIGNEKASNIKRIIVK